MNLPQRNHPGHSLEDWKSWEGRWELIDGVAYDMTPSPGTKHQELVTNLGFSLESALRKGKRKSGTGDCKLFLAPTDVFLPSGVVIPDLLVVCDPAKISPRGIEGAPDLVVEILSPTTASKDVTRKRWAYEAAGVPEYLIVDPDDQVAVLLRLEQGRYQEAQRVEWETVVKLLDGRVSILMA